MKPERTWILIADAGSARVYESVPGAAHLAEKPSLKLEESLPPGRDLADDRPGRSNPGVGSSRHGLQPTSDPRREMKRQFAGTVAEMLDREAGSRAFDKLVIAAPPVMLGDLRKVLTERVRASVTVELDKDLTKIPIAELESYIHGVLRP